MEPGSYPVCNTSTAHMHISHMHMCMHMYMYMCMYMCMCMYMFMCMYMYRHMLTAQN